jgi:ketol-acid reductoisomerase
MAYFTKLVKRTYSTGININNIKQPIILSNKYTPYKCTQLLENETISVLGYGSQGRSQSLNLRDNNHNVLLGLRPAGTSWNNAINDGWEPNKNLFNIDEATHKGSIIKYLISDNGQIEQWDNVKRFLYPNNTLYFSHGFGIHYNHYTNINPPKDINIIMISPKCSGKTVRDNFLNGEGFTSSFAIHNDYNNAYDICMGLAFSIGNNYIFETTFEKEVLSDLTGERCILMGMIQAAFLAQYKVLRNNGHSPLEAYHETIEEALTSLYPIIDDNGMDWLYKNCSTTAQRGAIDWANVFEPKLTDMVQDCYNSVKDGTEIKRIIECNEDPNYKDILQSELDDISNQEMWQIKQHIKKLKATNKWNGFLL